MDRLPEPLVTLKHFVEADLRRAARLIIKHQCELDPQIRMATPEGDYHLALTLPADGDERSVMLRRIGSFMVWKRVLAFSLACEIMEPDAVYCVGVSPGERLACLVRVRREPLPWTSANFAAVEWLPSAAIDPMIVDMLPTTPRPVTPKEISALEKWFGKTGQFPAVHVATRTVRGL